MTTQFFSAVVSVACLLYAKYLNNKTKEDLTKEQLKDLHDDVLFFSCFGMFTLVLSYL